MHRDAPQAQPLRGVVLSAYDRPMVAITLDFTTRPARVLLVAVRIAVPMAVTNLGWNFLELPTPCAVLLGALVYWLLGQRSTFVSAFVVPIHFIVNWAGMSADALIRTLPVPAARRYEMRNEAEVDVTSAL